MTIDPREQSVKENYKLMIGSVLPRPIAFVSTISADGIVNLAPFSFFTGISSKPMTIAFAPSRKPGGVKKDTLANIEATGEFVVNIVTETITEAMNNTATDFPAEINEFEQAGLTELPSEIVAPPRVKESPIHMECKLVQIVHVGPEESGGGALVIGEVVRYHVNDDLIENGRIDTGKLQPVGRLAGMEYTTLGTRFSLERKKWQP